MPALGRPIRPASAMTLSSRVSQRSSPGVPGWASRGARLVEVAKALLPRPPRPPRATLTSSPGRVRSRRTLPRSRSRTRVPGGTGMMRSPPRRPWQLALPPPPPRSAFQNLRLTISARLSVPATARIRIEPPSPPSPPSGPPLGTYFSRRKLAIPAPPSPPLTKISTRSTNMRTALQGGHHGAVAIEYYTGRGCGHEAGPGPVLRCLSSVASPFALTADSNASYSHMAYRCLR